MTGFVPEATSFNDASREIHRFEIEGKNVQPDDVIFCN